MTNTQIQIAAEIASLQRRADQLTASSVKTDRALANLIAEADVARLAEDATGARRLDRRIHLVRQRGARAIRETQMLEELIAARRARHGLVAPPSPQ